MGTAPNGNENKTAGSGVFSRAWIDTKNTITRKNRAGKSLGTTACLVIIFIVLVPTVIAFIDYRGFNSSFWEAFLSTIVMGLLLCLWGIVTIFLGMIAKYLRRALWPDSFKAISEAEDAFESAIEDESEDTENSEAPCMTEEEWELLKKRL